MQKESPFLLKLIKVSIIVFLLIISLVVIIIIYNEKQGGSYSGGYSPDGLYCNFGYNPDTKNCCDDDDYSCEYRDKGARAECIDGTFSFSTQNSGTCSHHGGVLKWLR